MKPLRVIAVGVILTSSAMHRPSTPPAASFDVASIKLHEQPPRVIDISASGPRLTVQASTVLA
jgi:hypothetical protein